MDQIFVRQKMRCQMKKKKTTRVCHHSCEIALGAQTKFISVKSKIVSRMLADLS